MAATLEPISVARSLRGPLILLGVVLAPPLLFCLIFLRSLDTGHVPMIVLPLAYVFFVAPVLSPIGLWLAARTFKRQPASRGWALLLMLIFVAGSSASWVLYLSGTVG